MTKKMISIFLILFVLCGALFARDPVTVSCPENQWTLVASEARGGRIDKILTSPSKYAWTYRSVGEPAPTLNTEGITCFTTDNFLQIPTSADGIDVYIYPYNANGSVRADVLTELAEVYIQDQFTRSGDILLGHTLNSVTIATTVSLGSYTIELEAGHNIVVGDELVIYEADVYYQSAVTAVSTNTITVSVPFFYPFTAAATAERRDVNIELYDGSVTAVIFKVGPPPGQMWDIYGVSFVARDATDMDDALFAGAPALTRGCLVAKVTGSIIETRIRYNSNSDMKMLGEFSYASKAPAGEYGLSFYKNFHTRNGISIRLDGDLGETVQFIVQDNLTVLTHARAMVSGHIVDPD